MTESSNSTINNINLHKLVDVQSLNSFQLRASIQLGRRTDYVGSQVLDRVAHRRMRPPYLPLSPYECSYWLDAWRMSRARRAVAVGRRVVVDGRPAVVDDRRQLVGGL